MAIITGQISQSFLNKERSGIEAESADLDTWSVPLSLLLIVAATASQAATTAFRPDINILRKKALNPKERWS